MGGECEKKRGIGKREKGRERGRGNECERGSERGVCVCVRACVRV
jgi:hypothetical protein